MWRAAWLCLLCLARACFALSGGVWRCSDGRRRCIVRAGFTLEFADDEADGNSPTPPLSRSLSPSPSFSPSLSPSLSRLSTASRGVSAAVADNQLGFLPQGDGGEPVSPAWPSKMRSAPSSIQNAPKSSVRVLGMRQRSLAEEGTGRKPRHRLMREAAASAEAAIADAPASRPAAPQAALAQPAPHTAGHVAPPLPSELPSFARPNAPAATPLPLRKLKPSKIRAGDFIVHSAYGIGRFEGVFQGLMRKGDRLVKSRFLKIRFRDATIEVPAEMKSVLKLFKRREEVDPLEPVKLDSTRARRSWAKRKARALKDVLGVAADLLAMYAERIAITRQPCAPDTERYQAFEADFGFTPTTDQLSCFEDIRNDMVNSDRPMDRLVCGDVGFGKTEAAMRAAFRAVDNKRQVAFLAPTTVLAAQHLVVLRRRMPPGTRVELLSSLIKRTKVQRAELFADIAEGDVDILVGTHAILSDQVRWANLGLLVVDEEQRFGVRQKEKMKRAALGVDVLSLSATPIPRTMYMCMSGIREMSTLHTPPEGRRPIVTSVRQRSDDVVREAIEAEVARGGQVFYVVPRVEHVERELRFLSELVPQVRLSYAFGGLKDLEQRIVDFTLRQSDVMVATTIMENGIDIPNVNTIIVQDTQLFGLGQLHQLRGRVGRSNVQAYALLMHPEPIFLQPHTLARLKVMQREAGLGAGHALAKADLELRGAGNVFGTQQKGTFGAKEVGTEMYFDVLQRAMAYLQKQRDQGVEVKDLDTSLQGEELIKVLGLDDDTSLLELSDKISEK